MCQSISTFHYPKEITSSLNELRSRFTIYDECSKGANSYLFFGTNIITNENVAIKYYYWGGDKAYHAEPRLLSSLESPNIIKINDAGLIGDDYAYFVTPLYSNGDIEDFIRDTNIGVHKALHIISDILAGLTHLHGQRLIHRDLKPQNIFLNDSHTAIIGDFGSIKIIPAKETSVPGSGHSLLYQPPESISTNGYSFPGDIYQVGIMLYQVLGGELPYDELSWLNSSQQKHYHSLTDSVEKTIYVDNILRNKITKGRIISISSLPPWVCDSLKRVINKACHLDPNARFDNASSFQAKIHQLLPSINNWEIIDTLLTLHRDKTSYRICLNKKDLYYVEKRKSGQWRRDNSFPSGIQRDIISQIETKIGTET